MNIQDPLRELLHEPWREQAHVSSQADQIDLVLLQRSHDFAIMLFARSLPLEGMTSGSSPMRRAVSIPPASVRLEMTTAMRASGIFPAATFLAMASKFEPRPERRMPRFFIEAIKLLSTIVPAFSSWQAPS